MYASFIIYYLINLLIFVLFLDIRNTSLKQSLLKSNTLCCYASKLMHLSQAKYLHIMYGTKKFHLQYHPHYRKKPFIQYDTVNVCLQSEDVPNIYVTLYRVI